MHKADLHHSSNRLQQKLEAIYRLRRTTTKVNWDNAQYLKLLETCGHPHLRLPPVFHVAGTNGKGSVIAFLRSILEADGKSVHVYTSPHLVKVNERIVIGGAHISDDYLESLIDDIMALNDGAPLSFFEIITAVAFKAFADNPADALLLEVGMGGRLDCTNVIPHPIVSIINRISLDHTEFLGDTIEAIAGEKAGIIKENIPCVAGYQGNGESSQKIHDILNDAAQKKNSNICFYRENYKIVQHENSFFVSVHDAQYDMPLPQMAGQHQIYNAALAVVALDAVKDKMPVSPDSLKSGVENAHWAGRLQRIEYDGCRVWLDVGHNDSAGEALAAQARIWAAQDERPLYLVVGMLDTKDFTGFLKPILPLVQTLCVVPIAFDPAASRSFDDFAHEVQAVSNEIDLMSAENVSDAVHLLSSHDSDARILIAGSVYLAGEVLDRLSA